ncbi:ABC transporter ATP-binding protein [Paenibacillus sp. IB182496]|uniref:ABC transporter ATP-binding protein n=1 Tax=Paenibacillus sabuli TaxID=2772509 RepID=A0A927BSZ8_9BACL|nr:ABC transporter ATP-binding protein [Paenibacillus sabuli]MBD2845346.1 ABC transporter ATP-binding protein [Paenibacillus sabuli]
MNRKTKNTELSALLAIAGEKKGLLLAAAVLSVCSGVLQLAPFVAVYQIIKEMLQQAQAPAAIGAEALLRWGVLAFVAMLASLLALYAGSMCSHIAAFRILYRLRVRLSGHVAGVQMGYHTRTASGEVKKIIESSVEKLENFIAHQLPDLVTAFVIPLLLIGYMFWLDPWLALVSFIPIVLGFWLQGRVFLSAEGRQAYRDYQQAVEEMNATGVEYVRGMPAVKIFGIKAESFLTFHDAVQRYRDISLHITAICKTPYSLFFVLISSLFTFVVPAGILLASGQAGSQSFALTFILFLILAPSLSAPLLKLMLIGGGLRDVVENNKRIAAIFAEPLTPEPAAPRNPDAYDIVYRGVTFAYAEPGSSDYKPALHEIDFTAPAGALTALVGPSGGGKSTIANLLLRFWDVTSGEIAIGGVPIREIGTARLMAAVSFVFQDVHLFYDTIEANIRMGNTAASREAVIAAAEAACCHAFIMRLPDGYATRIGEGGTNLSGGEAQRIAIARAILKDAPILVLDEATAYADAENEQNIQAGLSRLIRGKTVLMIAHRLSTIRNAQQILVIRQGRVVERGTHDALRAQAGLYEQMWQAHIHSAGWRLGSYPARNAAAQGGSAG